MGRMRIIWGTIIRILGLLIEVVWWVGFLWLLNLACRWVSLQETDGDIKFYQRESVLIAKAFKIGAHVDR